MRTQTQEERLTTEQTDNTETMPDETGAMMWVTDGLGKRRISQRDGGTGRHHWRWAGAVPIAEYKDAVRFGDRIALAEAASRFCNCHVVANDQGQGQLPRLGREE